MLMQLLALLPVAALGGWYMGKKEQQAVVNQRPTQLRHDYFKGLNYLINEQPDKAVDVFIKLLEVDTDTVDTHLALGNLFRRRGEVDRAIRIHQNLIARPQLDKQQKVQALSALGQDYLAAGVLDRAERLFLELVRLGEENQQSLQFLLHIYQQEKDWRKAIEIARKLETLTKKNMSAVIAQFYCEIADHFLEKFWTTEALQHLKRAQAIDPNCVRASLLRGNIAVEAKEYKEAIRCYTYILAQDVDYISEIIDPVTHCYHCLEDEAGLASFLRRCVKQHPRFAVVSAMTEYLMHHKGEQAAIEFMTQQIQRQPSLRGLSHLVGLYSLNSRGDTRRKLDGLRRFIDMLQQNKPVYRCGHCGFSGKILLWLCPGCHHWASVKPIQGIEGS